MYFTGIGIEALACALVFSFALLVCFALILFNIFGLTYICVALFICVRR